MRPDGPERRKQKRLSVNFIVTFRVNRPLQLQMSVANQEIDALMVDLSEGGMAITTDYEFQENTLLSIDFTLINPYVTEEQRIKRLELMGEVRSNIFLQEAREFRLGISFTDIADTDKKAIADFIWLEGLGKQ